MLWYRSYPDGNSRYNNRVTKLNCTRGTWSWTHIPVQCFVFSLWKGMLALIIYWARMIRSHVMQRECKRMFCGRIGITCSLNDSIHATPRPWPRASRLDISLRSQNKLTPTYALSPSSLSDGSWLRSCSFCVDPWRSRGNEGLNSLQVKILFNPFHCMAVWAVHAQSARARVWAVHCMAVWPGVHAYAWPAPGRVCLPRYHMHTPVHPIVAVGSSPAHPRRSTPLRDRQ